MKIKKSKLMGILGSIGLTTSILTGCASGEVDDIDIKTKKKKDEEKSSGGAVIVPKANTSSGVKVINGSKGIGSGKMGAGS
jgi:hypothetical protein